MKNLYGLKILFFLLFISRSFFCQWEPTNGPYGGIIGCFAVSHDSTGSTSIYAGTMNGVFLSTDNGKSWNSASSGFPDKTIVALAAYRKNVIAAIYDLGIYFSTDRGLSWFKSSSPEMMEFPFVNTFAVSGNHIFAGTNAGVFHSTDNGATWQATGYPGHMGANSLAIMGTSIFAGTDAGVFVSSDNGSYWRSINSGLPEYPRVSDITVSGNNIFAGTPSGVYLLAPNAGSWIKTSSGLPIDQSGEISVHAMASDEKNIYVAISRDLVTIKTGIFRSTDNGTSWKEVSTGLPEYVHFNSLSLTGIAILAGTHEGIFRSTDNGASWSTSDSGVLNTDISALAVNGNELYASVELQGVYLSTDNGESWTPVNSGMPEYSRLSILAENDGKIFAGGAVDCGFDCHYVILSVYGGSKWTDISSRLPKKALITSLLFRGSNIYAGSLVYGVFLSTNNGIEWDTINSGLPDTFSPYTLEAYGDNIFTGGYSIMAPDTGRIFLTTDNGTNWRDTGPEFSVRTVRSIKAIGSNVFAATDDGVYLSTDSGNSWTAANSGLPPHKAVYHLAVSGKNIIAESEDGIYFSTSNGSAWVNFSSGLPSNKYCCIAVSSTYIFAGTLGKGVWRRPVAELTDVKDPPLLFSADRFRLEQNYPNPFNPTTTIKFTITEASHVTLRIYDLIGQLVTELLSRDMSPGLYSNEWNAGNCASGIYFYEIRAGNYVERKKMILLR